MCWTCFLLLWSVSPLKWALGNRWATCQRNSGLLLESGASDSARTSWSCFRIRFVLTYLHSPSDPSLFSIDNKIEQKTQMMQRSSQQLWGWESQGFGCAGKFFLHISGLFYTKVSPGLDLELKAWFTVQTITTIYQVTLWKPTHQHNTTWHVRNLKSAAAPAGPTLIYIKL